jgi:hypothetical protein
LILVFWFLIEIRNLCYLLVEPGDRSNQKSKTKIPKPNKYSFFSIKAGTAGGFDFFQE